MSAAENFVSVIEQYFGQGMFLVLFVIAYVIFYRRSNERIRKGLIAGTIGVLCFLNPITFRIISALGEQETYYRLIWMVPVLLGAAHLCIEMLDAAKLKYQKALIISIMLVLFVLLGNATLTKFGKLPANVYQMDEDVVQIADAMDELSGGERVSFLDNGKLGDLIRQYNANVCLYMNGTHEINQMIQTGWTNFAGAYIRQQVAFLELDFIAIKKESADTIHLLESSGIEIATESDNYYLFQVKPEEKRLDNEYLASQVKDTITAINVEYIYPPKSNHDYEFLYVTNLFSNYNPDRVEEFFEIAKSLEVDAIIVNDQALPKEVGHQETLNYLAECGIPFVYNQSENKSLEFEDMMLYTADNANGDISEDAYAVLTEELAQGKSVLLATDQLINANSGQSLESKLLDEVQAEEQVLENYARGKLWKKHVLSEGAYGFEQKAKASHIVTLIRVRGNGE